MKKDTVRRVYEQEGNVIIIVALVFSILTGFTALAVDAGVLFLDYTRLARAADAAALAGAQELPDAAGARAMAAEYARQNGIDTTDPGKFTAAVSPDKRQISVDIRKTVDLRFARVLGFQSSDVNARAAARISPVSKTDGLLPLGLDESLLPLVPGGQYIIKVGSPSLGWTGIIEYPGHSGKNDYKESARGGYAGVIAVGGEQGKAPGNATGPTIQGLQERINGNTETWDNYSPESPRVVLVPIYRVLGPGPTDKIKVVGFAGIFLETITGAGNENEVHVRYVNHTISGETDDSLTNTFLNSVRLVE